MIFPHSGIDDRMGQGDAVGQGEGGHRPEKALPAPEDAALS